MKGYRFFVLLLLFYSCNNKDTKTPAKSENDIDAAREFIRSALDGKFEQAKTYLLKDSSNMQYMDVAERSYEKIDPDTKNGYRSSSINIHNVTPVNDSTTIVIFSNSLKNDKDTLRIIKTNGQWLVDLKYLYEHSMDTTRIINNKDSL
jgi:type IV secretory pathway component VirB8